MEETRSEQTGRKWDKVENQVGTSHTAINYVLFRERFFTHASHYGWHCACCRIRHPIHGIVVINQCFMHAFQNICRDWFSLLFIIIYLTFWYQEISNFYHFLPVEYTNFVSNLIDKSWSDTAFFLFPLLQEPHVWQCPLYSSLTRPSEERIPKSGPSSFTIYLSSSSSSLGGPAHRSPIWRWFRSSLHARVKELG